MTTRRPKAPKHLRPATRRWFVWVVENFQMEQHHVRVLTAACESWDRMQQAREAIAVHGLVYSDRLGNVRVRPEVAVERDSKIGFSRLLRELRLDLEAPESRPPGIGE